MYVMWVSPVRATIAMMKHHKQLGEEKVYLVIYHSPLRETKAGTQTGLEPGSRILAAGADGRAVDAAAYCLARHGLPSLLSCSAQGHLPRDGTTHGPSPINHYLQKCPAGLPAVQSHGDSFSN